MNVPGYNYLGPGNKLNNGEPVNETDRIAQFHDYQYDSATSENDILKADEEAIKKFWHEFRNTWTPGAFIGASGLYIKNNFEKNFGVVYPSSSSMSNKGFGLSLKRKKEFNEAGSSKRQSSDSNYEITPSLVNEFTMESMDVPDNGNNVVGSVHEGTNKQQQSTEQFKKTIAYIQNPKPSGQITTFKRSRIMRSWGNAHYIQKPATNKNNYRLGTSLVWLPVEYIEFYISEAEWNALPYGARVQEVRVKMTPIGSNVCFNTNASSTVWTNSTQTIFGYHSVGFNKSGWIEPFKIKTRTNDKPMILSEIAKVETKKDWERLWAYEKPDTLLPITTGVIRSIPWYTLVHYPAMDPHKMKGNWDITKYITQWEYHSHCGMPLINYTYKPKNGHTKHFIFPHYTDTTKVLGTDNILSTFNTTGQKNGVQIGQSGVQAKTETSNYRSLIEAYGRVENGLQVQTTAECQPSVHFGLMAVQSNTPDEGLDTQPEFVNASAFWQIDTEIIWSYTHNYYNLMEMSKGNAEQFTIDVGLTADQYYNNVSWVRHRDVHLLTVGRYTYTSDDRFRAINGPNTNEWTLQIKYPQLRDAGTYECQISTTPHLSRLYHLNVIEPKAKILGGSELYIDHGSTINLTCLIIGGLDPQGYVFWYHNNRIINENSPRGGIKIVTETGVKSKSVLLIHNARPTDSGRYECNPTNAHYKSVQIHVLNGNHPEAMQHNVGSQYFNTVSSYFNLFLLNFLSIILIKCLKYIS